MSIRSPHDRVTDYLQAAGWQAPVAEGPFGGIWSHPGSARQVPVPRDLSDAGLDWQQILHRIAEVEGLDPRIVTQRLSGRLIDIANLRAANDIVIRDTIPYSAAVTLVRNSWGMLRSSAHTSFGPKAHIRRFRKSADALAESARMAHTERGSFIIPILMPLPEPPEPPQDLIPGTETTVPESAERRVMRTFAEALSAVEEVGVRPEREPTSQDVHEMIRSGVSHEFVAALGRILSQPAVAEFGAEFEWASGAGPSPAIPARVQIPTAAVERIQRVAAKMKTAGNKRQIEVLTGPVVGVHRADDDNSGVVTIQTVRNARVAHVTVNVSRERLYEALDWMKNRETVMVEGRVHRSASGLQADRRDGVTLLRAQQLG